LAVDLPGWIVPVAAARITGNGVSDVAFTSDEGSARVTFNDLKDAAIIVLSNQKQTIVDYRIAFEAVMADERKAR